MLAPGRGFLLPLNYESLDTLFDYAGDARWVVVDPPQVEQEADIFVGEIREGEAAAARRGEPFVPAESLYLQPAAVEHALSLRPRLDFSELQVYRLDDDRPLFRIDAQGNGDLRTDLQATDGGLKPLADRFRSWQDGGWRTLLVCHTRGQAERLADLLEPYGYNLPRDPASLGPLPRPGELQLVVGDLSAGFRLSVETGRGHRRGTVRSPGAPPAQQ